MNEYESGILAYMLEKIKYSVKKYNVTYKNIYDYLGGYVLGVKEYNGYFYNEEKFEVVNGEIKLK